MQPLRAHRRPVHAFVDQVRQAGPLEQVGHGGAARDDGTADTRLVRQLEEKARPWYAFTPRTSRRRRSVYLVAGERVHRPHARSLVGGAFGKAHPSAREELPDRIVARPSVNVLVVVGLDAEGSERAPCPVDRAREQRVEGLLPRLRMRGGARDEHTVDAEDTCSDLRREPEQAPRIPCGADEPDEEPFLAAITGERLQQSNRGVLSSASRVEQAPARREIARRRLESALRGR